MQETPGERSSAASPASATSGGGSESPKATPQELPGFERRYIYRETVWRASASDVQQVALAVLNELWETLWERTREVGPFDDTEQAFGILYVQWHDYRRQVAGWRR